MLAILVILAGLAVWSLALLPLGVRSVRSFASERVATEPAGSRGSALLRHFAA